MKQWLKHSVALFFVLFVVCVPLQFSESIVQLEITKFLFLKPVLFLKCFFNFSGMEGVPFSSDSTTLLLLLVVLLVLAFVFGLLLNMVNIPFRKGYQICKAILIYFLIFVLLKYGFDKIFMLQFYPPEPNILYSPFGSMTKDILYWSVIGTSRFYAVALGVIEIGIAVMLLFHKTRYFGLLLALGVFLNIFLVNIGFDISVKILSAILIFATLFLLAPRLKILYQFFFLGKQSTLIPNSAKLIKNKPIYIATKTFLIGLFFIQILYTSTTTAIHAHNKILKNFNKTYKVEQMVVGNDTLYENEIPIQRIFFHKNSYLIFQNKKGEMNDYYIDSLNSEKLYLLNYQLNEHIIKYTKSTNNELLILKFETEPFWTLNAKMEAWQELPLLMEKSHFFVDEIK